jgi:nitrogen regulatory protein P-II 2
MHVHPLKLVTIIAEPVLEARITDELRKLGATGFNVVEGRGQGSRQLHATEVPGVNVRIETIVSPETAEVIVAHLAKQYFDAYAVIAYVSDVQVVRGEKYVSTTQRSQ